MIGASDLLAAFETTATAVVLLRAEDGAVLALNPAAQDLTGWCAAEAVGRTPSQLGVWLDVASRARLWKALGRAGSVRGAALPLRARNGRRLDLCLDAEPVRCAEGEALLCWLREAQGTAQTEAIPAQGFWFRCSPAGEMLELSRSLAAWIGAGADPAALRHRDRPGFLRRLQALRDGLQPEAERCAVETPDGRVLWLEERLRPGRGADEIVGEVRDLSAQVELEETLRQQKALFQVLVDNCRDGVFLIQQGRIRFANHALAQMLRWPPERLLGSEYMELVHPDDREAQLRRKQAREAGSTEAQRYRVRVCRGDGSVAVMEVVADAVWYQGALASSGVMRDVTEEAERQARLERAERRYRELFERAPVGLLRSRPDGSVLAANPTLLALLGYESLEQVRAELPSLAALYVRPEQRPALLEAIAREKRIEQWKLTLRRRDGATVRVSLSLQQVTGEDGEVESIGAVQDETARYEAERRLRRSDRMFRVLVDHAQVGVFISDGERFTYANETLARLLGTDVATLLARPVAAWRERTQVDEAVEAWRRRLSGEGGEQEVERCFVRADGRRVWVSESMGRLRIGGQYLLAGTLRDITRQREIERRLRYFATHDPLTGLPNRLEFQQQLDDVIREAHARGEYDYAVLFLDLDGFKLVNDSLGHAAGDRLLVGIAARLTEGLAGEVLVARHGGDEFTLLPYGRCDRGRAIALARRVIDLFRTPVEIGEECSHASASIGVVLGAAAYRDASQVLRDADTAMYRAKAAGKAAYALFDPSMHEETRRRFELEVAMRGGFDRGEFEVHFQPVVDLRDGEIVGCEALTRWRHPLRGEVLPSEFLAVAEESGLILAIDSAALQRACMQLRRWLDLGLLGEGFRMSINVNERQVTAPDFPEELRRVLVAAQVPASRVRIEITESVFRDGRAGASALLAAIKEVGVELVVDDFGTGYSSLDRFATAPFDALKIDRAFVTDLEHNHRHRAIVRTIIGFACDLRLGLVAEGVETAAQQAFLLAAGCRLGQGYRFGPALPAGRFEALLRSRRAAG